ncbi:MAG: PEP-CTERM sorting domain-containing protein [Planctomycetota bacterium]
MTRKLIWPLLLLVIASTTPLEAGLFEDIYSGLNVLATPSGGPLGFTTDGFATNGSRVGRVRIVPDQVGHGYTLEFNRNFGNDSSGRPEILDFGAYELELNGATSATLGYTNRGFLIGNGEINISNMGYFLRQKTGVQDFELSGTLSAQGALEINQFGFYTLDLDVSNVTSQVIADGLLAQGDDSTNFDVGPISIKGNIYLDALVAVLGALGVDTSALAQLTPGSPAEIIGDSINEQLQGLQLVASTSYGDGQLPPAPIDTLFQTEFASTLDAAQPIVESRNSPDFVPEPGTLFLMATSGALLWRARRR